MVSIIRKARKNYLGVYCEGLIFKNDLYKSFKGRIPKFNDNEIQIGIEYYHERLHEDYIKCNESALQKGFIDCLPWA